MPRIYNTDNLPKGLDDETKQCLYNGMDGALTHEIHGIIHPQLRTNGAQTYSLEKRLLGPVMTMIRRGIYIDPEEKERLLNGNPEAQDRKLRLGLRARSYALSGMERIVKKGKASWKVTNPSAVLQRLAKAVWGKELNYHSDKQLKEFFYKALYIPPITVVKKGERKISCDREALEKMKSAYVRAIPFCNTILRIRDLEKQIDVLSKGLSPSHRWAASYNIGGTDTGRWSSSDNPLRHSANVQNIDNDLRRVFVPDPGYVMVQCDQQGAESRAVAYLSGDENYIRAVESGDVHTTVAAMCWRFEALRELADRICYRDYSYRFMSKKLGHGSNYGGTPPTLARQAKVETKVAAEFQDRYFTAFPGLRDWQLWTRTEIQTKGILVTPFGRRRQFWSRLNDDATIRAGIAYVPQSMIGEITAIGIYNLWYHYEPRIQILANGHDAVIFQMKIEDLVPLLPQVIELLQIKTPVTDIKGKTRDLVIPFDAKVGMNWSDCHETNNPHGLMSLDKFRKKYGI